jgi:glutathione S-transferase
MSTTVSLAQHGKMPTFKLTYFNFKGRGELMRLIFAAAGQQFTDERIEMVDWPGIKPTILFGQLPTLEIDGKTKLYQSKAIALYLAKEFGLAGANNLEVATVHFLLDTTDDIFSPVPAIHFNRALSDEEKMKKFVEYRDTSMKAKMTDLEKYFKQHMSASGFLVGNKLSLADIAFLWVWDVLSGAPPLEVEKTLAEFPTLKKHRDGILQQPKIQAYVTTGRTGPACPH